MSTPDMTGENRCWPCTVANAAIGLVVAWLPLAAAFGTGDTTVGALATGWGLAVTGFTGYRIVAQGYLPLAELVAKRTGLHGWIGPETDHGDEHDRG